jgi:branched-chain amino acid transport system ATP-binding protein
VTVESSATALQEPADGEADGGLVVEGLTSGYGGLAAIRNMTFRCGAGEVLAMIGPNGAGKTTCLSTLVGLVRPMAGDVRVWGESICGLPTHRVARKGVALIPSDRGVFPHLTVADHLRLAMRSAARKERADTALDTDAALALLPSLKRRINARASDLSGGERQMLAIAKAVMLGPRVLLVDELSLGLAPKLVQDILPVIRQIADTGGTAVVLVEQHYELGLAIADRCVVLSHGEVAFEGSASEIRGQRDKVEAIYLARRHEHDSS